MNTEQEHAAFEAWGESIGFPVTGKYAETVDVLCAESAFKAGYKAGRAAQAPSGPEGWVMVPVQPTEVMKAAGCRALGAIYGHYGAEQCWKAMLDAAMRKEDK